MLGVILVSGYFFGLVAEKIDLPRVTAYLLAGVLFSDSILGHLISIQTEHWTSHFSEFCLGVIAYIVGGEINLNTFKTNGRVILWSTLFSSLLPVIFVFLAFTLLQGFLNPSHSTLFIILAALSSTTAPAATIAIIDQYKTKGELTDTTLGIVALDDAFGILIFSAVVGLFVSANTQTGALHTIQEIGLAIAFGTCLGLALRKMANLSNSNDYLFPLLIGLILLTVGLSHKFAFSTLLSCMIIGLIANNFHKESQTKVSLLLPIQHIEEFIFITFFTLAGMHFSPEHFSTSLPFIICYVFFRGLGKYFGAHIGAKIGHPINPTTPKWLGLTLLPQAGVAIGLLLQLMHYPEVQPFQELLFNIVLGSTMVSEVLGPLASKIAFRAAGEI